MSTELATLEVTELSIVAEKSGVELATAKSINTSFADIFAEAKSAVSEAKKINVTDVSQVAEMKAARAHRLTLKTIRCRGESLRKSLKEDANKRGKAIELIYDVLEELISPVEKSLLDQEQFAERKEAERKSALKIKREAQLAPYKIDTTFYPLGEMPDAAFAQLLDGTIASHERNLELGRKAEAERIARERAEAEERERVRTENARLKAEASAREEAIKKERAEALRVARLEREALEEKARIEREDAAKHAAALESFAKAEREKVAALEAKIEAEKYVEAERIARERAAKKKAEGAPEREKLRALARSIQVIEIPKLETDGGKHLAENVRAQLVILSDWLVEKLNTL